MAARGRSPGADARIGRLAGTQYGVASRAQLLALGLSKAGIETRLARGQLVRIHRGVFAVGRPPEGFRGRVMAAVLATGGVASHRTAAGLRRLAPEHRGMVDITYAGCRAVPGVRAHRSALAEDHVAVVDGIPVTTIERTLIDLCDVASPAVVRAALRQAEVHGRLDLDRMRATLDAHPGRRTRRLRAMLPDTTQRARSKFELRVHRLLRRAGLGHFETNALLRLGRDVFEVDLLFARERVVVELDTYGTHGGLVAFDDDRRRDRVLQLAGFTVLRFSDTDRPGDVVAHIRAALSA